MRQFLPVAVVLGLGALLWLAIQFTGGEAGPERGERGPGTVAVEAVAVQHRAMTERVRFSGSLEPATRVVVAPRITGRLDTLHVGLGDRVETGDLLAELDDEEFRQEVAQARAELMVARAGVNEARSALESAQRRLRRTRELRAERVASEAELEAAETEVRAEESRLELAEAQVSQREAAVRAAEIRLGYTRITAGEARNGGTRVVTDRQVDPGNLIQANAPLLTLVELDPLRGVVFATERDYVRLEPGQPVELRADAHPGETFQGRLTRLAPEFRQDSRQARVELEVDNPEQRLRPGLFIEARVVIGQRSNVPTVPRDALLERDGERGLFMVTEADDDGPPVAQFTAVEVGIRDGEAVEIRTPDLAGQRVVTLGRHLLTDGTRVRIADDANGAGQ